MYAPLSKIQLITPLLILLSGGLIAAIVILGGWEPTPLVIDWIAAGAISTGIWHIVSRFSLDGGAKVKAYAISWPLLSLTMTFGYCYFPHTDIFYRSIAQMLVMLMILTLEMSLWQRHRAILKHLLIGLLIGGMSALIPHTLTWLLFLPLASYFMRSWSSRNILSALTGVIFGIWMAYCVLFLTDGMETADAMIRQYAIILREDDLSMLSAGLGLWQYLFLGLTALLLVVYSFTAIVINPGSVRVGASIKLVSVFSFLLVVLMLLDLSHLTTYLGLFSLFLSLQLTIHQSNIHSAINEWWTLLILVLGMVLCILPLFIQI